jgi:hypothetical protein
MEPLVQTLGCPNCGDAMITFNGTAESDCDECGFHTAIYRDKVLAAKHYSGFRRNPNVIVGDPVKLNPRRWAISHTEMFLV